MAHFINNAMVKKSTNGGRIFYAVEEAEHPMFTEIATRGKETSDERKVTGIILEEAMTSTCVVGCIA